MRSPLETVQTCLTLVDRDTRRHNERKAGFIIFTTHLSVTTHEILKAISALFETFEECECRVARRYWMGGRWGEEREQDERVTSDGRTRSKKGNNYATPLHWSTLVLRGPHPTLAYITAPSAK